MDNVNKMKWKTDNQAERSLSKQSEKVCHIVKEEEYFEDQTWRHVRSSKCPNTMGEFQLFNFLSILPISNKTLLFLSYLIWLFN